MRRTATAILLLSLTACGGGGGDDKAVSSPTPSPTVSPKPAQTAARMAREIAIAEETYVTDNNAYLAYTKTLPAGFEVTASPTLVSGVALVPGRDYCVVVEDLAVHRFLVFLPDSGILPSSYDVTKLPAPCLALARVLQN